MLSSNRIEGPIYNFNAAFGNYTVDVVKRTDLEGCQERRLEDGVSPATLDIEVSIVKTKVTKDFDDGKIGWDVVKAFRTVKRKLKRGANARTRTVSIAEYKGLIKESPLHLRTSVIIGYNTG